MSQDQSSMFSDAVYLFGTTLPHRWGISFEHPWWVLKIVKEDLLHILKSGMAA